MDSQHILAQATAIAHEAFASAKRADALEETVRDAENSPVPVLRSLAGIYRMLQHPFM